MTLARMALVCLATLMLAGCGASDHEELQAWMTAQRNAAHPHITPISAPKQFIPQSYTEAGVTDPFNSEKLTQALRRESGQAASNAALVAPELARRKEPLEAFPLDSMVMVGSLGKPGQPEALIQVDKLLYLVHIGNYLGQNYGRITKITETQVTLREIVQDATGEWIERPATLQLQERSK